MKQAAVKAEAEAREAREAKETNEAREPREAKRETQGNAEPEKKQSETEEKQEPPQKAIVIEKPSQVPKTEENKAAIKEQHSMLYRLHNEVANLNGRMAKSHQEFYDYVNLRLNEYVRLNQFHVL